MASNQTSKRSRELFDSGLYCAESVLMAIAESQGIESDIIPRIATGFCSGMSRTCDVCGALSGAIMGLGLMTGRSSGQDSVEETYTLVQELKKRFEERFGSTHCQELIECDLGTQAGQEYFMSHNMRERCLDCTEGATEIVMALTSQKE